MLIQISLFKITFSLRVKYFEIRSISYRNTDLWFKSWITSRFSFLFSFSFFTEISSTRNHNLMTGVPNWKKSYSNWFASTRYYNRTPVSSFALSWFCLWLDEFKHHHQLIGNTLLCSAWRWQWQCHMIFMRWQIMQLKTLQRTWQAQCIVIQ